jgi:N-acetylmuramoyl-L-alanine amidase|tara:strand:- start:122 stop:847 length:726 start_codon:yes stop_codon:yes gene_type:complete
MALKITNNYSPNFSLRKRSKIRFIIIHYTGMKKESSAIKRLCDFKSNVSAHYFIKKNGNILNLVPDLYEAWHAGASNWKKYKFLNKNSIGIEIQNPGHEYGYENFTLKQINSLRKLLKKLMKSYKINLNNVLGHSDIAPVRKKDPGEKFPWENLAKFKLAKWHKLKEKKLKKFRLIKLTQKEEEQFLKNLFSIGYNSIKISKSNFNNRFLFKAFQRRFRQNLINGKSDQECLLISKNLLKP